MATEARLADLARVGAFTNMGRGQRITTTFRWLLYAARQLIKLLRGTQPRFAHLTPPLFSRQLVYDRTSRTCLRLRVRDMIDVEVMHEIFEFNDYGFEKLARGEELARHYERLVASGVTPLIVDCGANSGMASAYFSVTYPEARIIAVEPEPENLALARVNNPGERVRFILAGVGHSGGRGRIVDPKQGNWAYRIDDQASGPVEIVSISQLLAEHCDPGVQPFIIKIDIEGSENALFLKNTEWLDLFPVLVIELHDWMLPRAANSGPFLREIAVRDRDFVYHGENIFSISNQLD
jgi:FkbM family methyltransferase